MSNNWQSLFLDESRVVGASESLSLSARSGGMVDDIESLESRRLSTRRLTAESRFTSSADSIPFDYADDLACDLMDLLTEAVENEEDVSDRAFRQAGEVVARIRTLPCSVPAVAVMAFDGGIRFEWKVDSKSLRIMIMEDDATPDYLYHEDGEDCAVEHDLSTAALEDWIRWLY